MIYLDYSADTPVDPRVAAAFLEAAVSFPGNPNSVHAAGRAAKAAVDGAVRRIAERIGVLPEEVILTSGASEANNLALKGAARADRHKGRHIISTPLEHSSVSGALTALQEQGWEIDLLDVLEDGSVDTDQLAELLREDTVLVSVCAVDSELGTVQPIQRIAEIVKWRGRPQSDPAGAGAAADGTAAETESSAGTAAETGGGSGGCLLHVDATQAVGKTPLRLDGVDLVTFAPHKFYGLHGSGVLVKREGVILEPLIHGGASTTIYRSGTPDAAAACALAEALAIALDEFEERAAHVASLNRDLRKWLSQFPAVRINSPAGAVPHILNLSVRGVRGEAFQRMLDERGVCVSVKSACSVRGTPSRAVYAVSRDRKNALSSWRISLSHLTERAEIEQFEEIFVECLREAGALR